MVLDGRYCWERSRFTPRIPREIFLFVNIVARLKLEVHMTHIFGFPIKKSSANRLQNLATSEKRHALQGKLKMEKATGHKENVADVSWYQYR